MTEEEILLQTIYDWCEFKPWFDTEFIDSLQEFYEKTGFLTEAQMESLQNIIDRFHIN